MKPRKSRQAKTDKVPATRCNNTWTESAFFSFVRSGLRQASRRWPPLVKTALERVRQVYVGPNKRQKWAFPCAVCLQLFKRTDVKVDHIIPCGSLRSFADLPGFAERLFCEVVGFQVLCLPCHKLKTDQERADKKKGKLDVSDI